MAVEDDVQQEDNDFGDAFDETDSQQAPDQEEEHAEVDDTETSDTDNSAEGDVGNDQQGPTDDEREAQRQRSWEGRLRKREEELEARARELEAKETATQQDTDYDSPDNEAQELTQEDQDFLDDFPELVAPLNRLVEKKVKSATTSVNKEIDQKLKPLTESAQKAAEREHYRRIESAHEDVGSIVTSREFDNFINSQPSFVRASMEQVKARGTADEIIELLDTYKSSRNASQPNDKNPDQAPKSDVVRKGSNKYPRTVGDQIPIDDFDAAFESAT